HPGWGKAFFVCAGRVCATRSLPPGAGARLEINAGLTLCRLAREHAAERLTLTEAEDLLVLDGFAPRPPPELAVLPLDAGQLPAHLDSIHNRRAAETLHLTGGRHSESRCDRSLCRGSRSGVRRADNGGSSSARRDENRP